MEIKQDILKELAKGVKTQKGFCPVFYNVDKTGQNNKG